MVGLEFTWREIKTNFQGYDREEQAAWMGLLELEHPEVKRGIFVREGREATFHLPGMRTYLTGSVENSFNANVTYLLKWVLWRKVWGW